MARVPRSTFNGNTPAYAGKIRGVRARDGANREHPRIRGEDRLDWSDPSSSVGTPPHTRGRSIAPIAHADGHGNTPAYAGKMRCDHLVLDWPREHPRIRGEDIAVAVTLASFAGTPPHTRGRYVGEALVQLRQGNTPAYAGKMWWARRLPPRTREHPRIRGEDTSYAIAKALQVWNTPAYAGKMCFAARHDHEYGEHPRIRGEDPRRNVIFHGYLGTPPHTRGRLLVDDQHERIEGNTPAYAGKIAHTRQSG